MTNSQTENELTAGKSVHKYEFEVGLEIKEDDGRVSTAPIQHLVFPVENSLKLCTYVFFMAVGQFHNSTAWPIRFQTSSQCDEADTHLDSSTIGKRSAWTRNQTMFRFSHFTRLERKRQWYATAWHGELCAYYTYILFSWCVCCYITLSCHVARVDLFWLRGWRESENFRCRLRMGSARAGPRKP